MLILLPKGCYFVTMNPGVEEDKNKKLELFTNWVKEHSPGKYCKVFESLDSEFKVAAEFIQFLKSRASGQYYVYILLEGSPESKYTPLYIGKTSSPLERWLNGHIDGIKAALKDSRKRSSYKMWIERLRNCKLPICLVCISELEVHFPPIPNFPVSIGSIEYQLISLASDAYGNTLLNSEGVAR